MFAVLTAFLWLSVPEPFSYDRALIAFADGSGWFRPYTAYEYVLEPHPYQWKVRAGKRIGTVIAQDEFVQTVKLDSGEVIKRFPWRIDWE